MSAAPNVVPLDRRPASALSALDRFAGSSKAIAQVRGRILGLAPLRVPVLVCGEPGTGRDLVVRALHENGSSAGGTLHTWRAETQQPAPRDASAIYLDGLDSWSGAEAREWLRRVGDAPEGGAPRFFASTTALGNGLPFDDPVLADLAAALGRFRIVLPALHERVEDLDALIPALAREAGAALGRPDARLSAEGVRYLQRQCWPGNVRQLRDVIDRAIAFSPSPEVALATVEDAFFDSPESLTTIRAERRAQERDAVLAAVKQTGGNISHAAELLGRSRASVYRVITRHGIPLREFRAPAPG